MPTNRIATCRRISLFCVTVLLALFATPSIGHAMHFDYLIAQEANGRLVTGTHDFDNGNALTIPVRVFYRDLDDTFFSSDPGYSAVSPANVPDGFFALPPSTSLYFDMMAVSVGGLSVSNLWYWNGQADVNFQPSVGAIFMLTNGNNSTAVDGSAAGVTGIKVQDTTATGSVHRHASYQLTANGGGAPDEGLYMIAQEARMPGLTNSIPYYTLFVTSTISDTAYTDAQNWAKSNLVVPGDVNNDGRVDIQDITLVANHWLQTAPAGDNKYLPIGDANYDTRVDIQDITLIANHWLQSADSLGGGAVATPVPEPATLALALIGAALVASRARSTGVRCCRVSRRRTTNHLPALV